MAKIILKRSAVLKVQNISKKTGQMSSNFGEIVKKLIPIVFLVVHSIEDSLVRAWI
jgi:hypothetical protein